MIKTIKEHKWDYVVLAIEGLAMSGTMTIVDEAVKAIMPPHIKLGTKVAVNVAKIAMQLMAANKVGGYIDEWFDSIKAATNIVTSDQKKQLTEELKNE